MDVSGYVGPPRYELRRALSQLERDFPDNDADWLANAAIRRFKAAERTVLLAEFIADSIRQDRRAEARRVEQRAYRAATNDDRKWRREYQQEKERVRVEDPLEYRRRYPTIGEALDDFRAEIRLELTAELMATTFALGDGRSVTWGRATVAQHRQRAAKLVGTAVGTLQTVALHEEAIAAIEAAGVSCLRDVQTKAA